jgi:hypothetical protein
VLAREFTDAASAQFEFFQAFPILIVGENGSYEVRQKSVLVKDEIREQPGISSRERNEFFGIRRLDLSNHFPKQRADLPMINKCCAEVVTVIRRSRLGKSGSEQKLLRIMEAVVGHLGQALKNEANVFDINGLATFHPIADQPKNLQRVKANLVVARKWIREFHKKLLQVGGTTDVQMRLGASLAAVLGRRQGVL